MALVFCYCPNKYLGSKLPVAKSKTIANTESNIITTTNPTENKAVFSVSNLKGYEMICANFKYCPAMLCSNRSCS